MKLDEALKFIRETNGAVYAVDATKLEIFFIEHDEDPERFAPDIVYYNKYSEFDGEHDDDIFPLEEYIDSFPHSAKLNYYAVSKTALGFFGDSFDEVVKYLELNRED